MRRGALDDLLRVYDASFTALSNGTIDKFAVKYRSKKKLQSESIVIVKKGYNGPGLFYKTFFESPETRIKSAERLPKKEELQYDCHLQRTKSGEYYFCLPMPLDAKRDDNQVPTKNNQRIEDGILALDPGVRTFQTGYSPSGIIMEWGKSDILKIQRLCRKLYKLQKRMVTETYSS